MQTEQAALLTSDAEAVELLEAKRASSAHDFSVADLQVPANQRAERFARRRHRLYEFQTQLSEQLQKALSEQDTVTRRLGIVIGPHHCLLELGETGEVAPTQAITPVPWTQSWFLGLANLRGHLIGVVDGAAWLGLPPTLIDRDCRIVALAPALGMQCGLLVSRVTGLHDLRSLQPAPDRMPPEQLRAWSDDTFVDNAGLQWTALSLAALARTPHFLQAALPGAHSAVAGEGPPTSANSLQPG